MNVICRFRFGAPTFRTARARARNIPRGDSSPVLYRGTGGEIATKHMLSAVHSIYLATSSAVMRDGQIRDAEGPGENPLYCPVFDRKSRATMEHTCRVQPNFCILYAARAYQATEKNRRRLSVNRIVCRTIRRTLRRVSTHITQFRQFSLFFQSDVLN